MVDFNFDKQFNQPLIGVDEVGRGSWAGPVMACAALLNYNKTIHQRLNDSKKLKKNIREEVFENLKNCTLFGIGEASNNEIDKYGILQATFYAMQKAIKDLIDKIQDKRKITILIDGDKMPNFEKSIIANIKLIKKGDSISPSIAAASIIAKCTRDNLMNQIHKLCNEYDFDKNKGYGTRAHQKKLFAFGPTQFHRMTFSPMKTFNQ